MADLTVSQPVDDLLACANAAAMRTQLGLAIGTDVQAYDADLDTWAGVTPSADGQSLVSAANYAAMRALLGAEVSVLAETVTPVDVVGTVTETTIYTHSIAGNAMGATGEVQVELQVDFLNSSGVNRSFTLRIKLGSTTLYADACLAVGTSANRRAVSLSFKIKNTATNAQVLTGDFTMSSATAPTTGTGNISSAAAISSCFQGSASEDTTSAKTLTVTVENSNNSASLSTRLLTGTTLLAVA